MDVIAFLRKFSLIRLLFESIFLIAAMMALTAHNAARQQFIFQVNDQGHPSPRLPPFADEILPELAIGWLLFYFMVPRTIVGFFGILNRHPPALMAHVILSAIIFVMYCFMGLVCVFTESPIELVGNFITMGIEVSTVLISYKLWQHARSNGGNNNFDWKRFLGDQVVDTSSPA